MRRVSFIVQPTIITRPGNYRTRGGEVVTIENIGRGAYAAQGHYPNGTNERWDICGRVLPFSLSQNDILEPV
jgi:hypothetical protein